MTVTVDDILEAMAQQEREHVPPLTDDQAEKLAVLLSVSPVKKPQLRANEQPGA
jgi:hypothetical protein